MGIPHVNGYLLKNTMMFTPSMVEQEEIVNVLKSLSKKFMDAINKIDHKITTLKEYRKTLIHETVTGRIRIRDKRPRIKNINLKNLEVA